MISAGLCFKMLHHISEKFWRSERDKVSEMERDGQTTHSHTHSPSIYYSTPTARYNSRGEGRVVLCSEVIWVQVEHADHEGHKHHDENNHKLEDVLDCAPQWNLQGSKALIGWQYVGDAREAQNDGDGVQAFWDDLRIWWAPLVSGWRENKPQNGCFVIL